MSKSPTPPDKYVPEFCSAMNIQLKEEIQQLSISLIENLKEFNEKIKEITDEISTVEKKRSDGDKKIYGKISELKDLYHIIDKEFFKVKEIYKIITEQSKINEELNGQLISIEKRLNISFKLLFLIISICVSSFYFLIRFFLKG